MSTLDALLVLLLAILLVGSAFLALAEVALLRVQRVSLAADADPADPAEPGDASAERVLRLLDELPVVLNTVLLVVLFAQVCAAAVSGYLAQRWFGGIGVTVVAIVVTIVLFIYAEVIPKTMALRAPQRSARRVARPVRVLVTVLRPVTRALLAISDAHLRGGESGVRTHFTEQELRTLTLEAAQAGAIEVEDAVLVERSFEFGDARVGDVRVPRDRIVAADVSMKVAEALELALEHGHRRLPVTDGGLDDIVGVVRLRDLAAATASSEPQPAVGEFASAPLVVSPMESVAEVLKRMQATGRRFAVVAEAGGPTEGIVTIEDLVAELVGEIEEDG